MSRKLIVNDGRGERELLLIGKMVVGRDPACDVSDADPLLSRRHAEFVVTARDVMVRDLGSRNGILINGIKVNEGALRPGDIVQVGHLQLRYMEDAAPLAVAPEAGGDADATAVILQAPRATPSAAAPAFAAAPSHAAAPAGHAPPIDESDKTRLVATPAYTPPAPPVYQAPPPRVAPPPPTAPPPVSARGARVPVPRPEPEADRKARVAKRPWTLFVLVQVVALATVVFISVVVPLTIWQTRVLNATGSSSASALVNWLAADASAALRGGGSVADAADAVGRQAGVISALIVAPDGRVLSPPARSDEIIQSIPAINKKPADIFSPQLEWNGDRIETARPVAAGDRPRAAIAWLSFRPTAPPEAGSGAVWLAIPVIIVLVATYIVTMLITRRTMHAFTMLNEDIELAVGGKLDAVGDPLGAKPIKDLSDAVNYLIARLRAATGDQVARPDLGYAPRVAPQPQPRYAAPSGYAAAPPQPAPAPQPSYAPPPAAVAPPEARIVASSQFRVTEASKGCADLLGTRPDALVGEHLIDAIPDRQIGDAVMQCLSALPAQGEQRKSVTLTDRPYTLAIVMARGGKDQPITITFKAEQAAQTR